ncbi:MAG TPA: hypothetical protein VLQ29_06720 [Candidatus Dormibacteraeota bacterium]|nr:hypothetical protein [Candidatus Dormibacteraeota bacterium]
MRKHKALSALEAACHPERGDGSRADCAMYTNAARVTKHVVRGPSPSTRLGMTAV